MCLLWDAEAPTDLPSDQLEVAILIVIQVMSQYASRHGEPRGARKNRGRSLDANSFAGVDNILGVNDSDSDKDSSDVEQ